MGYKPEIHKEAKSLHGYSGDERSQKANIILPKSQVGAASNDVGFLRKANGKYEMIVSEFDQRMNFSAAKVSKLKQMYAKSTVVKHSKKAKHKVMSQQLQPDGSIKLKVRVRI